MTSYPITCHHCGAVYDGRAWDRLPSLGIHLGCLDARRCNCGDTLAAEIETFALIDHEGDMREALED